MSQVVKMHARKEMLHAPACPGRERSRALGFAGCERGLSAAQPCLNHKTHDANVNLAVKHKLR